MRRLCRLLALTLFLSGLSGCKSEKPPVPEKAGPLISQDAIQGKCAMEDGAGLMLSEKGYYYYSYTDRGLRYYDFSTQKDIFLCNKPECLHDGNAFCVATNRKYGKIDYVLYGDRIYMSAFELDENERIQMKLLEATLDGAELSEVTTYFEFAGSEDAGIYHHALLIHRNKAFIAIQYGSMSNEKDAMYYGAVIVDLVTGEKEYLGKNQMDKENPVISNISAYGEHFYYCVKEGKKKKLFRYCISDNSETEMNVKMPFSGRYAVLEEDTIVSLQSMGSKLCIYHPSTGVQEEKKERCQRAAFGPDGNTFMMEEEAEFVRVVSDGTYLYCFVTPKVMNKDRTEFQSIMIVYNNRLEKIVDFDLLETIPETVRHLFDCESMIESGFFFFGGDIYYVSKADTQGTEGKLFRCKRNDFLQGAPVFEPVAEYRK